MHYLELIKQIDETLFEYQVNIDIIEKDYPDEQLKNIDYEELTKNVDKKETIFTIRFRDTKT